jgi:hypothetical protein
MSDPIIFRGLTKEKADATVKFHVDNGADAIEIPDGTGHFSVSVTYPDSPTVGSQGVRSDGIFNAKYGVYFIALVANGFFSSDPDNLSIPRSVRTNNPGALDISPWQKKRPGYAGVTKGDGRGNVTTIYSSPEYGVAAWYFLLSDRYRFAALANGAFTVEQLAEKYAGSGASTGTIANYVNGWSRLAEKPITGTSTVRLDNDDEMLNLARAMYKLEAGAHLQISNDQIVFGILNERNKTLPPAPQQPLA